MHVCVTKYVQMNDDSVKITVEEEKKLRAREKRTQDRDDNSRERRKKVTHTHILKTPNRFLSFTFGS